MLAAYITRRATQKGPKLLLLGFFSLLLTAPAYSQSLGDIARQERARKQSQPARETHVYDNSDLQRTQILVPEDRARAQASAPMSEESAGSGQGDDALPLGDIARKYRAMKAQSQSAETQSDGQNEEMARGEESRATANESGEKLTSGQLQDVPEFASGVPGSRQTARAQGKKLTPQQPTSFRMTPSAPSLAYRTALPKAVKTEAAPKAVRAESAVAPQDFADGSRVRVKAGDTLWKIAIEYFGRGSEWLTLAKDNPQMGNPGRLRIGMWISLPDEVRDVASKQAGIQLPAGRPSRNVRVEQGDSLWRVAQVHLGEGRAWACVARANPEIRNSDLIFPGEILVVPDSCAVPSRLDGQIAGSFEAPSDGLGLTEPDAH